MKRCKGCGEILQYENKNMLGYSPKEEFDYCQRCFRLLHYGDVTFIDQKDTSNDEIIASYDDFNDALFVLIVDPFDALFLDQDYLLKIFKTRKDLLLIINKIDLLPKNIKDEKINDIYLDILKRCGNINCLLTYKNDRTFNELFFNVLKEKKIKKVIFTGRANVGKSSLINKLIANNVLTASIYPGTTLKTNEIIYKDYLFIDTAGLIDDESFLSHLNNENIKKILPLKTIKRQIFQLYNDQSYMINGLLKIDFKPRRTSSVEFMIANNLIIHRSKLSSSDLYFKKNGINDPLRLLPLKKHDYFINGHKLFYLKGLGLIKINGCGNLKIDVNDKIKIYNKEVNI